MKRLLLLPLALASMPVAAPASAADRSFAFGSYDRVRIEGPFEVRIETGASPGATASGDARALDRVDLVMQGNTLVVHAGSKGWGETPLGKAGAPATIVLRTPRLASVFVTGGGRVVVGAMKAQRVDLSLTGSGTIAVTGIDADEVYASAIGAGSMTLAGRTGRARLVTNGTAMLDAAAMPANDLVVLQNSAGETRAAARYTAQLRSDGLGRIVVTGTPKCVVQPNAVGPIECGVARD